MKIKIFPPIAISHKGIREGNEDAIYPEPGTVKQENRFFIVCDGVGGSNKGEVASRLACDMFGAYFEANRGQEVNAAFLSKALEYAEASFDGYFRANPHARGMATTIALAYFHQHGVEVAWCGDTRVYHIRKDQILFRTEDHSLVNDLVRSGTITEEQASKHPNRNVISRAIQGTSQKKTSLDVHRITDVQPGDYFFICTDGVWEPVSDQMLIGVLSGRDENALKLDLIMQECQENSKDNYSCYLIQVEHVEGALATKTSKRDERDTVVSNDNVSGAKPYEQIIKDNRKQHRKKLIRTVSSVLAFVVLATLLYFPASFLYEKITSDDHTETHVGSPAEVVNETTANGEQPNGDKQQVGSDNKQDKSTKTGQREQGRGLVHTGGQSQNNDSDASDAPSKDDETRIDDRKDNINRDEVKEKDENEEVPDNGQEAIEVLNTEEDPTKQIEPSPGTVTNTRNDSIK